MDSSLSILENQKNELKEFIAQKEREMKVLSRRVSELQEEIIGLKGGLVATEKAIKEIKEK